MILIEAPTKLGLKIHTILPNSQSNLFFTQTHQTKLKSHLPKPLKISCSKGKKKSLTGEKLAIELGLEIKKLNTQSVQREEALKRSRELLFSEMCNFAGLKSDDLKKKWKRMSEEEKWVLAKDFVGEWSAHFHPLSARSVKEMVDEYLGQDNEFSKTDSLFAEFRKFLGF